MLDSPWAWAGWAAVLIVQNMSHGLSSRAKNSPSYLYNMLAAILSNGVWFISNAIMVRTLVGNASKDVQTGLFYVLFCVVGSVLSQWAAIKWIEPRFEKRKGQ